MRKQCGTWRRRVALRPVRRVLENEAVYDVIDIAHHYFPKVSAVIASQSC